MKPSLVKAEASGNDFIVGWGTWAERLAGDPELVRRLCARHRGIGADGTLALFPERGGRVLRVVYRNCDGSRARFCANGTRAAARVGHTLLGLDSSLIIDTDWAPIPAQVTATSVSLELPALEQPSRTVVLSSDRPAITGTLLQVGIPHLIVTCDGSLDELDLAILGPRLAHHEALGPAGANVSFVKNTGDRPIGIRSFELGVEAETLCCGSALVAAALIALAESGQCRIDLAPASGDVLTVEALAEPPCCSTRLSGPARLIAHLEPRDELVTGCSRNPVGSTD